MRTGAGEGGGGDGMEAGARAVCWGASICALPCSDFPLNTYHTLQGVTSWFVFYLMEKGVPDAAQVGGRGEGSVRNQGGARQEERDGKGWRGGRGAAGWGSPGVDVLFCFRRNTVKGQSSAPPPAPPHFLPHFRPLCVCRALSWAV